MPRMTNSQSGLERRLTLLAWLQSRLGYADTVELLSDIKQADEGFDDEGRSHTCARLKTRASQMRDITVSDLERYDDNIREHLAAMNAGRTEPITLRYFQYLAALCTEIFLDRRIQSRAALLASLNTFVDQRNSSRASSDRVERFEDSDLNKLAFWMATGSGKTLLMHLNYLQFLHYNREQLDNILLITPNEGLSAQHIEEMQHSGIPTARFDLNESGMLLNSTDAVKVTEITKLVMEKRGEGETVPVEAFGGNNLIFVDEGHKGSGGEAWREIRDILGETGFTFEYSATFGQALSAARNDALTVEYGKAIAFDYSYRYFYNDGYGKDFHILNLLEETTSDDTDRLLLGNMLSFYEQRLAYNEHVHELRPYNLDKPLWVFVGSRVNAVRTENRQPQSDVLTLVNFLHRFLSEPARTTQTIEEIMQGMSGLRDVSERDIFADKFGYLRSRSMSGPEIYADMLETVLHTYGSGALHLCDIRSSEGEIGLKAGGAEDYFGVVYIGDAPAFKRLVQNNAPGIVVEDDAFSNSLFDSINEPDTTVDMLIGSRKFIEGWNSWRVSNMGLLNIGTSEGSQIIQLFGRGVRLRGRDMSLKRSSEIQGRHPPHIRLLETLNIFGVRANYMSQFRNYLEREGIPTDSLIELPLLIRPNREFLDKGLVIPRLMDGLDFNADAIVPLEPDCNVRVTVDISARVQTIDSNTGDLEAVSGAQRLIPRENLDMLDWNRIYLSLLEHKQSKGMDNLLIRSDALRRILETDDPSPLYSLIAEEHVVNPRRIEDLERLQEATISILRKYADALYRHERRQWETNNMVYKTLDDSDPNLRFNIDEDDGAGQYRVRVPSSKIELIQQIERLIDNCRALYETEDPPLPRIHFDRHLYQPLLLEDGRIEMSPPGLVESERRFVSDLREYWAANQDASLSDVEAFLLRNQSRGAGVGFYEKDGFYPDFILWIKQGDAQRLVFIEPHGMMNEDAYIQDDHARLHERLPELASAIAQRSDGAANVRLDSFIVSATPYEQLYRRYDDWSREKFAQKHILFQESQDYVFEIFRDSIS